MDQGFDGAAFGAEIAEMVRGYVDTQVAPIAAANAELAAANEALTARLAAVEAREPTLGEDAMKALIEAELISQRPAPLADGAVAALVKDALAAAVAELPPPEKGEPGEVDMAAVETMLAEKVGAAVAALPSPADGAPGKDGIGVAGALIDAEGGLVLTLSNGETRQLGRVMGAPGRDGKDGENGQTFTLDDFDIVPLDDPRDFKFCFTSGEVMHSFELSLPGFVDKGVWREGDYRKGDAVSWGGQQWLAERDSPGKPDTENCGWRLAVKKGRDGRDGTGAR